MEFDVQKSFGYPVLRTIVQGEEGGELLDYPKTNFDPSISKPQYLDVQKDPDHFHIKYDMTFKKPQCLLDAISNKNASIYLYVLCRKTFYSKLHEITDLKGSVKFRQDLFRYNIETSAFIIANKNFALKSSEFHEDYGEGPFEIKIGDVLAWSYPRRDSAEKGVYRSIRSMLDYSTSDEIEVGDFVLKTDENIVLITVNPKFLEKIKIYQMREDGQKVLAASLIVPVIIQLLNLLKDNDELAEEYSWATVLADKCEQIDADLENTVEFAAYAQKILGKPLKKIICT